MGDKEEEEDATPTVSALMRQAGRASLSLLLAAVYASLGISLVAWAATFVYGTFYLMYAPTKNTHRFPLNFGKYELPHLAPQQSLP